MLLLGMKTFNVKEKEVYRLKNKSGEKYAYKGSDGKIKLTDDKDEALSGGAVKEKEIQKLCRNAIQKKTRLVMKKQQAKKK